MATIVNSNQKFFVTKISSKTQLGKGFRLSNAGALEKSSIRNLTSGRFNVETFATLKEFARFLDYLTPKNALTYGFFGDNETGLVVSELKKEQDPEKFGAAKTRTRNDMSWNNKPGILFLDYDPPANTAPLSMEELINMIKQACPFLADVEMLWRPSSSSLIKNLASGQMIQGLKGQHIYIVVGQTSQIKLIGKIIVERLWLAGFGRYDVSVSGSLMERTIVDSQVWQPERLDYVGGSVTEKPLKQMKLLSKIFQGKTKVLSLKMIPELSKQEHAEVIRLKAKAKRIVEPEGRKARDSYIDSHAKKMAGDNATHEQISEKRRLFSAAFGGGVLYEDFVLCSQEGKNVTVKELLDSPEQYHGKRFADPIEPEYNDDRRIAYADLANRSPNIYSHAHGGRLFSLKRKMPVIQLESGDLSYAVDTVLKILRDESDIFDSPDKKNMLRFTGRETIVVTPDWLTDRISRVVRFDRFNKQSQKFLPIDPPKRIAERILAKDGERNLNVLQAVYFSPVITPAGRMINKPGYDEEEKIFLAFSENFPEIPINPTPDQLKKAYNELRNPFEKFPFVDDISWSVMLAAILTTVCRPCLTVSPAFAFDAPSIGSGKTLLARSLGILASGVEPEVIPPFDDDSEAGKVIFSCLLKGSPVLVVDNQTQPLKSANLSAVLTAELFSGRQLGESKMVTVPTRVLWLFTGNNIKLGGDQSRRILVCRIDPQMEAKNIYKREFNFSPTEYCKNNRVNIISAALTIFNGYISAGRPNLTKGQLGSFEDWSSLVRQTVVWLGQEKIGTAVDPVFAIDRQAEDDDDSRDLSVMLEAWHLVFNEDSCSIKKASERAEKASNGEDVDLKNLRDAFAAVALIGDRIDNRRLGKFISSHEGKVVNGKKFKKISKKTSGVLWWAVQDSGLVGSVSKKTVNSKKFKFKSSSSEKNNLKPTNPLLEE